LIVDFHNVILLLMSISITSVSVGCYAYNLVATLQSYSSNFSMLF